MIDPQPGMAPRDLVPGDPDEAERLAGQLGRFAHESAEAARRLAGLDSEHWSGPAAERFRDAVSDVPARMRRGAEAFEAAARELTGYARVLRDGLRAADRAIGLAEQAARASAGWRDAGGTGPDPGEPLRQQARRLAEQAARDVRRAALAAAQRLGQVADRAPASGAGVLAGRVRAGDAEISTVVDHQLADPDGYVAGPDTGEVRYGADHHVAFAGGGDDWDSWAGGGADRSVGSVSSGMVAGAALLLGGRRRRTALEAAGLEPDELRRRPRPGRPGDGTASRAAGGWRTNLAGRPRVGASIRAWSPEGNPLRRGRVATPVTLAAAGQPPPGTVLHSGPPAAEGYPGRSR